MLIRTTHTIAFIAAPLLLGTATAQEPGTVTVDVEHCLTLTSDEARRECFATQVDEIVGERAAGETARASADNAAVQANGFAAAENSPVTDPVIARQESRAKRDHDEADDDPEVLSSTIASVRERVPNAYLITLENGQVWLQVEPKQYPLRPGLAVRLQPSRWGKSYRLIVEGAGHHVQVRRVR